MAHSKSFDGKGPYTQAMTYPRNGSDLHRNSLKKIRVLATIGLSFFFSESVLSQESITLKKIQTSGTIVLGYRENSAPFSYLDLSLKPIGYTVDICMHLVSAIKWELRRNDLRVQWMPVTATTRFPMMLNRTIDMECGVTTNTPERQKMAAFSVTTFVTEARLLSKKSRPIERLEDLRGQAVVSTAGTTNMQTLVKLNDQFQLQAKILTVKDDAEAFNMVASNRAVAYAMDDALLRTNIASAVNASDYMISKQALTVEPYGIMLPRGDDIFKKLVDQNIKQLYQSGSISNIYRQWFNNPIPPLGINLQMPMPAAMEVVIKKPTDSSDPAQYR